MRRRIALLIVSALLLMASGCGSLANLRGNDDWLWAIAPDGGSSEPFGGVGNDVRMVVRAAQGTAPKESDGFYQPTPLQLALMPLDLPLSFALDTVTLPWVVFTHACDTKTRPRNRWLGDDTTPSQISPENRAAFPQAALSVSQNEAARPGPATFGTPTARPGK